MIDYRSKHHNHSPEKQADISRCNQFNWCGTCRDWFKPLDDDDDKGRTRIGNTPTCEDCGKPVDSCNCEGGDSPDRYDYAHQAWVVDGKYISCGHTVPCDCYGRIHAGEQASK